MGPPSSSAARRGANVSSVNLRRERVRLLVSLSYVVFREVSASIKALAASAED